MMNTTAEDLWSLERILSAQNPFWLQELIFHDSYNYCALWLLGFPSSVDFPSQTETFFHLLYKATFHVGSWRLILVTMDCGAWQRLDLFSFFLIYQSIGKPFFTMKTLILTTASWINALFMNKWKYAHCCIFLWLFVNVYVWQRFTTILNGMRNYLQKPNGYH